MEFSKRSISLKVNTESKKKLTVGKITNNNNKSMSMRCEKRIAHP
jgi:hypothetical protein